MDGTNETPRKVSMRALAYHTHDGAEYHEGDEYEANEGDVENLVTLKFARRADLETGGDGGGDDARTHTSEPRAINTAAPMTTENASPLVSSGRVVDEAPAHTRRRP